MSESRRNVALPDTSDRTGPVRGIDPAIGRRTRSNVLPGNDFLPTRGIWCLQLLDASVSAPAAPELQLMRTDAQW